MRFQGGRDTCIYDYIHDDDDDDDVDDDDDDDPPLSKVRTWTSCEMVNYWFFDCLPQQFVNFYLPQQFVNFYLPQQFVNFYATTIKTNLQQAQFSQP